MYIYVHVHVCTGSQSSSAVSLKQPPDCHVKASLTGQSKASFAGQPKAPLTCQFKASSRGNSQHGPINSSKYRSLDISGYRSLDSSGHRSLDYAQRIAPPARHVAQTSARHIDHGAFQSIARLALRPRPTWQPGPWPARQGGIAHSPAQEATRLLVQSIAPTPTSSEYCPPDRSQHSLLSSSEPIHNPLGSLKQHSIATLKASLMGQFKASFAGQPKAPLHASSKRRS